MPSKKNVMMIVAIAGLAAVLAGALSVGRLRGLSLRNLPAHSPAPGGAGSEPDQVTTAEEPVPVRGTQAAGLKALSQISPLGTLPDTSRYTASVLRDPLKSFLPQAVPPVSAPIQLQPANSESSGRPANAPPASEQRAPMPNLTVQGLVWGGPRPQVIINDKVYSVGDMVGGGKIVVINRHGVGLEYNGARAFFSPASASGLRGQQGGHG